LDRLIYVQAITIGMTLVTSDSQAGKELPADYPTIGANQSQCARSGVGSSRLESLRNGTFDSMS